MALVYEKWDVQPTASTIEFLDRFLLIQNSSGDSKQITWQTIYNSLSLGTGITSVTASSPLASSGGLTPNITLATPVPVSLGGSGRTGLGTALQVLRTNAAANGTEWATLAGSGTVTSTSVVTANGVSGSVANATTTPAITLTLGAITPTSVNGNTITTGTGTLTLSTFTLTAIGNGSITGNNTGDQINIAGNSFTSTNLAGGSAGQIPYQTAPNTTTFLPVGTNGYVLTLAGGLPTWAAGGGGGGGIVSVTASSPLASSGGATPNISLTNSIPISFGGTGVTSVGTQFQVLRTNSGATGTEWATASFQWTSIGNDIYNNNLGNIGINQTSPAAKLDVFNTSSTTTIGVKIVNTSGAAAIGTGLLIQCDSASNTQGVDISASSSILGGINNAGLFTADGFNSGYNTGITVIALNGNYNTAGGFIATGGVTATGLHLEASGATNNYGLIVNPGRVGFGTEAPSTILHVVGSSGSIRYQDGSEGAAKVLTSDANGVATWQALSTGSTIPITDDTTTNATEYFVWVSGTSGSQALKVSSTKLTFNSSTGNINFGNATSGNQRLFQVGQDTSFFSMGSLIGTTSQPAIYMNQTTPTATNYVLTGTSSVTTFNGNPQLNIACNGVNKMVFGTNDVTLTTSAASSGAFTNLTITNPNHTNQTASTEIPALNIINGTKQWATGALTIQRAIKIGQPTYSFVGASTITDAATIGILGAPIKSTNATITNTHALLIQAGAVSTALNSYGLTVNAQTGATTNYTAAFLGGRVGINTALPTAMLDVISTNQASPSAAISATLTNTTVLANNTAIVGNVSSAAGNNNYGVNGIAAGGVYNVAGLFQGSAGTTAIGVYADAQGGVNNYALVTQNGNVGIGTLTPTELFQVSGTGLVSIKSDGKIKQQGLYLYNQNVIIADDGFVDLPSGSAGFGYVQAGVSTTVDGAISFRFDGDAIVTETNIADALNSATADTDTKLCVFDNGTQVRIKNRLGGARSIYLNIYHN